MQSLYFSCQYIYFIILEAVESHGVFGTCNYTVDSFNILGLCPNRVVTGKPFGRLGFSRQPKKTQYVSFHS